MKPFIRGVLVPAAMFGVEFFVFFVGIGIGYNTNNISTKVLRDICFVGAILSGIAGVISMLFCYGFWKYYGRGISTDNVFHF